MFWLVTVVHQDENGGVIETTFEIDAASEEHAKQIARSKLQHEGHRRVDVLSVIRSGDADDVISRRLNGAVVRVAETSAISTAFATAVIATPPETRDYALDDGPESAPTWISRAAWQQVYLESGSRRVYAVIDGSLWLQSGKSIGRSVRAAGLRGESLFQQSKDEGVDADDVDGQNAPWLVDLTISDISAETAADSLTQHPFHNAFFGHMWPLNVGIILLSDKPFQDVKRDLRKLTKVQDVDEKWFFNRFWEPEFFLYLAHFLHGRRLLAPLGHVSRVILPIAGDLVTMDTQFQVAKEAPQDREGDLEALFDAGTAMVGVRHARKCEASFTKSVDPDDAFALARDSFGLFAMDYKDVCKCVEISYVLLCHYADEARALLRPDIIDRCLDEDGGTTIFFDAVHGQCMFGLKHNIAPHLLRVDGGIGSCQVLQQPDP
jgi:hypothetical protein